MAIPASTTEIFSTAFEAFQNIAIAYPDNMFLCVPEGSEKDKRSHTSFSEYTYGESLQRILKLRGLFKESGVGHGHRVALLLGNRADYYFCLLALNSVGAWAVPINPESSVEEMAYQIIHSDVELGITINAYLENLELAGRKSASKFSTYDIKNMPGRLTAPQQLMAAGKPGLESISTVLYTSGTTGKPKGCLISNETFLSTGAWYLSRKGHQSLLFGRDRLFNPLPAHHMNAGVISLMAMVLSANCLVQWDHFHPKSWWRDVAETNSTIIHYMGLIPPVLVKQEASTYEEKHKIRFGLGAGCDPDIHVAFEKRFKFPLIEVWGMTETGRTISNSIEPRHIHTRAFGKARDGLEVMIADDDGQALPVDTPGNFLVRFSGADPRKGFFSGYLNDKEATEQAWRGGWLNTGDICRQDSDGMLYFVDRKKNIIRRSGENIAAAEVEAAIAGHSSVRTVACLPVPDSMRDEEVMACIVLQPDTKADQATAASIFSYCSESLAYFKTPGWIVFRKKLPTTQTSKIRKSQIFEPDEEPTNTLLTFDFRSFKRPKRKMGEHS